MRRCVWSASVVLLLLGAAAFAAGTRTRPLPWLRETARPGPGRSVSFCPRERFQARLARPDARAGDPDTLPEFLLDTLRTFGPSPGDEELGGIAAGGSSCLAVWATPSGQPGIRAARLTNDGAVIDSVGFRVSPTDEFCAMPAAGFDGTNWLVAWIQFDTFSFIPTIRAARVSPAGAVLDPQGIAIATGDWEQYVPVVGFDGTNWLVAWTDFRSGGEADVYATRVSPAGNVLDPQGIPVSTATGNQVVFRGMSADGTNSLVAWHDDRNGSFDIYAARITPAGTVLDPAGIQVAGQPSEQGFPSVAFDGGNYLLAWIDDRAVPEEFQVYAARLTPAGSVLDPAGIRVTEHNVDLGLGLAFGAGNHLVTWANYVDGSVYAARVSPAGNVLDPAGFALSAVGSWQYAPAVCFTAGRYVAAWVDYRNWNGDIYATPVMPDGSVPDPARLITWGWSSPAQYSPVAAFDGTNWLVAWADDRDGIPGIYATRVTRQGAVLDPQGIAIAVGGQWAPAIAFDGSNYLVAWEDWRSDSDVYAARVSPGGVVLDPQGIAVATGPDYAQRPAVAADGANWLVAWLSETDERKNEIRAARVTPVGGVLEPAAVYAGAGTCLNPAVAAGPGHWLVTWDDDRDEDWVYAVYAARVNPDGSVADPNGFPVAAGAYDRRNAAVASDGTNWLVAWEHDPDGSYSFDIHAARVSPQGAVLDPDGIRVMVSPEEQYAPDVAFDGSSFRVAWENDPWSAGEIRAGRVSRSGVVLDPGGVPLISGPLPRREPRLAPDCGLLVFNGYVPGLEVQKALAALLPAAGLADRPARPAPLALDVRPSPARGRATVCFSLPNSQEVRLSVHDPAGRLVRTLASGRFPAGRHERSWDLRSDAGGRVAAGVYLLRLAAGPVTETRKLVVR